MDATAGLCIYQMMQLPDMICVFTIMAYHNMKKSDDLGKEMGCLVNILSLILMKEFNFNRGGLYNMIISFYGWKMHLSWIRPRMKAWTIYLTIDIFVLCTSLDENLKTIYKKLV